ncbi:MAG: alpha/beta hydrolase, partial [Gammaproteobacteria bacterium]|nr:alpha/beta hydrolase [Gammaproteobacteria bacterium]
EARVHALSRRIETPCGRGRRVWHAWGNEQRPALMLFHGGFGAWRHWILNVVPLSRHFAVYAADLPGLGDSDQLANEYTAENIAAVVARGVDEILPPPARFHVAGFSFGGIIGGHVTALQGARAASYVTVGAGGLGLPAGRFPELESMRPGMSADELAALHRFNLSRLMIHDQDRIDDLAVHVQAETVRRARVRSGKIPWTDTLARAMRRIHDDTGIAAIWGENDVIYGPYLKERRDLFRAIRPGCEFRVIEDAGHWVMYERAAEFNAALLEVLS